MIRQLLWKIKIVDLFRCSIYRSTGGDRVYSREITIIRNGRGDRGARVRAGVGIRGRGARGLELSRKASIPECAAMESPSLPPGILRTR